MLENALWRDLVSLANIPDKPKTCCLLCVGDRSCVIGVAIHMLNGDCAEVRVADTSMVPEWVVAGIEDAISSRSVLFTHTLHYFSVPPNDVVYRLHTRRVVLEEMRYIFGGTRAGCFVHYY